jgi:hypothetical protein
MPVARLNKRPQLSSARGGFYKARKLMDACPYTHGIELASGLRSFSLFLAWLLGYIKL